MSNREQPMIDMAKKDFNKATMRLDKIKDIMAKNMIFQKIVILLEINMISMSNMKTKMIASNINLNLKRPDHLNQILDLMMIFLKDLVQWALLLKEQNNYFVKLLAMMN